MIPIENGLAATSKMAAMAAILKNPLCSDIHEIFRKLRGHDTDDPYWKWGLAATSKMAAMAAILKNPLCSDIHDIFRKVRGMTRMIPIENGLAATSKMAAMVAILKNPLAR